jgi:hypothetical protein
MNYLLKKYRDKNYPLIKLRIKKNLFDPSSLLMRQKEMLTHYKSHLNDCDDLEKDLDFLRGVENTAMEKLDKEEKSNRYGIPPRTTPNSPMKTRLSVIQSMLSKDQMEQEIIKNKEENSQLRELIKNNPGSNMVSRSSSICYNPKNFKGVIFNLDNGSNNNNNNIVPSIKKYRQSSTLLEPKNNIHNFKFLQKGLTIKGGSNNTSNNISSFISPKNPGSIQEPNSNCSSTKAGKQNSKSFKKTPRNQSSRTILSIASTANESTPVLNKHIKPKIRSPNRKPGVVYNVNVKGKILDKLYNHISSREIINSKTRDEITMYLKTFTGFFDR